jgi:hypothetical protein
VSGYARGSTYGSALLRTWGGALTEQEVGQLTENLGPDCPKHPHHECSNYGRQPSPPMHQRISRGTNDQIALPTDFPKAITNTRYPPPSPDQHRQGPGQQGLRTHSTASKPWQQRPPD